MIFRQSKKMILKYLKIMKKYKNKLHRNHFKKKIKDDDNYNYHYFSPKCPMNNVKYSSYCLDCKNNLCSEYEIIII